MTAVVVSWWEHETATPMHLMHKHRHSIPLLLLLLPPQVFYVFLSFVCGYYSARLYKSEFYFQIVPTGGLV